MGNSEARRIELAVLQRVLCDVWGWLYRIAWELAGKPGNASLGEVHKVLRIGDRQQRERGEAERAGERQRIDFFTGGIFV